MNNIATKHFTVAVCTVVAAASSAIAQTSPVMAVAAPTKAISTGSAMTTADSLINAPVAGTVAENAARIAATIEASGGTVFARVDHAAGAASVGLKLMPSVLVIFGNPKLGTPLMQADPTFGVDLPLRVLVHEVDGRTVLTYHKPEALARTHGVPVDHPSIVKMTGVLAKLAGAT